MSAIVRVLEPPVDIFPTAIPTEITDASLLESVVWTTTLCSPARTVDGRDAVPEATPCVSATTESIFTGVENSQTSASAPGVNPAISY